MNRIIIERSHQFCRRLCELGRHYDYPHNTTGYVCVDVDDESLLLASLCCRINPGDPGVVASMGLSSLPTYIVMRNLS